MSAAEECFLLPRGEKGTCSWCVESPLAKEASRVVGVNTCWMCGVSLQPALMPTGQTFQSYSLPFRSECKVLLLMCVRFGLSRDVRGQLVKALTAAHYPVLTCQLETVSESVKLRWFSDGAVIFCHLLCTCGCEIDSKVFSSFPLCVGRWKLNPLIAHSRSGCNGIESSSVSWKMFVVGETAFFRWDLETAFRFPGGLKSVRANRSLEFIQKGIEEVHCASLTLENNVKRPV